MYVLCVIIVLLFKSFKKERKKERKKESVIPDFIEKTKVFGKYLNWFPENKKSPLFIF
jgi:hypothetical protein